MFARRQQTTLEMHDYYRDASTAREQRYRTAPVPLSMTGLGYALAADFIHGYQSPGQSIQCGFWRVISAIFFSRLHPFSWVSRAIALCTSSYDSQ